MFKMINEFISHYPSYQTKINAYREISPYELCIRLNDDTRLIYDTTDKTIRFLPRDSNSMTEQERRHEFGIRLRRLMWYEGMTQEKLSDVTGITQAMISRYLTGHSSPSFSNVDKICKALGCSMDRLRYFDDLDN